MFTLSEQLNILGICRGSDIRYSELIRLYKEYGENIFVYDTYTNNLSKIKDLTDSELRKSLIHYNNYYKFNMPGGVDTKDIEKFVYVITDSLNKRKIKKILKIKEKICSQSVSN